MARKSTASLPRRSARCVHCGKELPLRRGRPARVCPTCGSPQEHEEDALLRRVRVPSHEFHGANLVGVIVGGIIGLFLGLFFGALLYRNSETGTLVVLTLLHGLGFAFLGCAFGFMAVASRARR